MTIFVGNISWNIKDRELHLLFASYGIVDHVKIKIDRDTGRSRGFAFVSMPDKIEANIAIGMIQDTELDGRKIRVMKAQPRPKNTLESNY